MKTYILLEVSHTKPLPDLSDMVAGRVWTLDGVKDTSATVISMAAGWAALERDRK